MTVIVVRLLPDGSCLYFSSEYRHDNVHENKVRHACDFNDEK